MARRYRMEYLIKKKRKERRKQLKLEALERKREAESKSTRIMKEILGWAAYAAIIILATYLVVNYVGQRTRVSGSSMEPTLHNEDNLIVDKITYRFREPKRYEIIVFPFKHADETYYIKRIIGLPGETIQVIDGYVYLNGEKLEEDFERIDPGKEGLAIEPITLGEEEYFVMGDNRNHSSDSRDTSVGVLTRDDFVGRAWIRIWPFEDIGVISHE